MCGIAGIFSPIGKPFDPSLLLRMTNSIRHRGPDDEGYLLVDSKRGCGEPRRGNDTIRDIRLPDLHAPFSLGTPNLALGWRRLSIIDLSPTGHQPMSNEDGSLWIVFNGEIYNYLELRKELAGKGYRFRTNSDTEVILHSFAEWGPQCLNHFNGMWGFALWDARSKRLFCSRDRFGVKPFYYWWDGTTFAFASEIKALLELPFIPRIANDDVVYDFLVHRVLDHTANTFFKGIQQLRPGSYAEISDHGLQLERYYDLPYNPEIGQFSEAQAGRYAETFLDRFTDSVRLRLRSDVTVGSCLSGGIDSSAIVCTVNNLVEREGVVSAASVRERQKTFTATYDLPQYSEDKFVQCVIKRTKTSAYFITPTAETLWNDLSSFIRTNDEPLISTSMYAQWCVMKLASEHGIKVLLDGQGADELLAGYRRWHFPVFHAELLRNGRFSDFKEEIGASALLANESSASFFGNALQKLGKNFVPRRYSVRFNVPSAVLQREFVARSSSSVHKNDKSLQERLLQDETLYNLPQLLHYEDRNSMRFSIEARVPFVDYRLIELVMQMPAVYKIHKGWSKYILRHSMQGILPEEIQWRRDKMGFVTPEKEWLRTLMPRLLHLLSVEPFRSSRYVKRDELIRTLAGSSDALKSYDVWRCISLELWMREFDVSSQ